MKLRKIYINILLAIAGIFGITACGSSRKTVKNVEPELTSDTTTVLTPKDTSTVQTPKDSTKSDEPKVKPSVIEEQPRIRLLYGVPPTRYSKLSDDGE